MSCKCGCSDGSSGRVDYQYAAKVVCGEIKPVPPGVSGHNPLPPGQYFTKINIHNSSRCDCVTFRWKVAVGAPQLKIGPVSDFSEATLCADEALEIDCSDIMRRLGADMPGGIEGWVVVESPSQALDIVAVYGTAPAADRPVSAFHTERVQPRCMTVCEDFDLDISTGVARWEVAGPFAGQALPGATFTQATLGPIDANWPAALPGSLWIHPAGPNLHPEGVYTYRLTFKLCSGFRTPRLEGLMMADYFANAFLNGHSISTPPQTGGPNYPNAVGFAATSHFKAGLNELIILVTNRERGTTGLSLHGEITVANGLCAGESMPLLACPGISYRLYTRHFWWQLGIWHSGEDWWGNWVSNGAEAGTTNQHRRAEALEMTLSSAPPGTQLEYRVWYHTATGVQLSPATGWGAAPQTVGSTTQNHPIVAVQIRLINAPLHCHVRYKVHRRKGLFSGGTGGWSNDWVYDGAEAGAHNYLPFYRIEALVVEIVSL